ncbi:MAG: GFA family protein [Alsobacter sp.]
MIEGSRTGGCLCGGVGYRVTGRLRDVVACYCKQCQRTSGNYVAASRAANADLEIAEAGTLAWYRSSEEAERGFCTRCGGNLFWRVVGGPRTSIMAGTLDDTTGLAVAQHIYVADRAGFQHVLDAAPAWPQDGPDIGQDA